MEHETTNQQPKKRSAGKLIYILLLVIFAGIFLVSAGMLVDYFIDSQNSKQTYSGIKDLVGEVTRPTGPVRVQSTDPTESVPTATSPYVTVTDPNTGLSREILRPYAELYLVNPDLCGWISIPGTRVDYPVVHRPDKGNYYLYRDFYGKNDSHGCIYAREVCDINRPSDNITIYGHRMKDNTMFADLALLQDKDFWQDHQYIYFDTLTEYHTYQIIYVLTTTSSVGEGFAYHQFVDFANEAEFDHFLSNCAYYSVFSTGLTATYGDKLITLSTCEYTHENGRLVVVAKRID